MRLGKATGRACRQEINLKKYPTSVDDVGLEFTEEELKEFASGVFNDVDVL